MSERIVYSTLCALDGSAPAALEPLVEMAGLWAAHLRGPARFGGRVVLLTNVAGLRVEGTESVTAPIRVADRRQLFLERVRQYACVPVRPGDQVMQLDLDALAVAPLDRVFDAVAPATLMAATSTLSPMTHEHAGGLMTRGERWSYRVRGWYVRPGVSACLTACRGADWPRLMRRWAAAIRARGRGRPLSPLGDQAFLNLLFVTGAARVRRLPAQWVCHIRRPGVALDDPDAARASVLHFPMPQKAAEMRRWSRV